MRHEPTTDELPVQQTVELPDNRKTVELPGKPSSSAPSDTAGPTTELPAVDRGRHRPETIQQRHTSPSPKKSRFWRELTGALAAGTVLLAIAVLVLQTIAWLKGMPGLGVVVLVGHLAGAGLAVAAQRMVDHRAGRPALAAGLGLGAVVVVILVLFWWI